MERGPHCRSQLAGNERRLFAVCAAVGDGVLPLRSRSKPAVVKESLELSQDTEQNGVCVS